MSEKKSTMIYWLPLVLFILMLVDGQVSNFLRGMTQNQLVLNSHALIFILIFASFKVKKNYLLTVSIILGLLFDNYYYGIIGIYMLCLPLMVLMLYKINESIKPSVFSILMSLIIFVTFIEGSTFFLQTIFQLIKGNPLTFITNVLGPTLLLNITLFVLLIYPLKKLFRVE